MNKLCVIIILSLLAGILASEDKNKVDLEEHNFLTINDSESIYQPKYMEVPILNNYLINQPIKETIKWGSIGWTPGYVYLLSSAHYDDPNITAGLIAISGMTVGSIYGLISGLYKGTSHNKGELSFHSRKLNWGHEMRVTGSKFDQCYRSGASYYFFRKINGFVDKVSIGYSFTDLSNSVKIQKSDTSGNIVEGDEKRYLVEVEKSFFKNGPYAISCAIGTGYSESRLNRETYYNNFNLQTAISIEFNIVDFFYFKPILEYDLLGFRNDLNNHYHFLSINYLSFGCAIGSYIF